MPVNLKGRSVLSLDDFNPGENQVPSQTRCGAQISESRGHRAPEALTSQYRVDLREGLDANPNWLRSGRI